ncbi:g2454 [Coccomyxa elongata]
MEDVDLKSIAEKLTIRGKGILASDESTGTIGKRLEKAGLQNTEDVRRAYRENFYTADIGNSISGAILFKETLYQHASDGVPFVKCLTSRGVLPGIKVDQGLVPMPGSNGETSTRGLETLASECKQYWQQGARFTKWRAALKVSDGLPSEAAIQRNAQELAEYAAIAQACDLVPIVEPEILIDGDYTLQRSGEVSQRVLQSCIAQLWRQPVDLEATLLKPMMVMPGADASQKASAQDVAVATLDTMRRSVPPAIPGIMFLSGGLSEKESTLYLNAINNLALQQRKDTWALSFSFGRALQASVLQLWTVERTGHVPQGSAKGMAEALARANAAAAKGQFQGPHPSITSLAGTLRENFRGWRTDVI